MTINTASFSRPTPIGLDIGERWIKAVQLLRAPAGSERPWRLLASARFRRKSATLDHAEIARIESILNRRGFTGGNVVLTPPANRLVSAALTLPPTSSGAPLDQIAKAELARASRRDPDGLEIGWWPVPTPAGGPKDSQSTHAIAVSYARADIDHTVSAFDAVGLDLIAMDAPAWAFARGVGAILRAQTFRPELCAVLDLGWTVANLIVLRDGVPVFERELLDLGIGSLHNELSKSLAFGEQVCDHIIERVGAPDAKGVPSLVKGSEPWSTEPDEASRRVADYLNRVAAEVSVSLSYLTHRYPSWPVDALMVVGGGAMIPGACERLGAEVHLPTRAALPSDVALPLADDPAVAAAADQACMIEAMGLALYPVEEP